MTNCRPKRSWFGLRFSLRALLIAMVLLAVTMGALRQRSIAQHHAAKRLRAAGAEFIFSDRTSPQSNLNWWLYGDDRYDFTWRINFDNRTLSAEDMAQLKAFRCVFDLRLTSCKLDAQACEKLGSLRMMRALDVEGGSLAAIESIPWERLENLDSLLLSDIDLSRLDCQALGSLERCTLLCLMSDTLSDHQLQQLKLPRLNMLRIAGANISDAGLKFLVESPDLQYVTIEESRITGSGLSFLHPRAEIDALGFKHSGVTPKGLEEIAKLKSLTLLDVRSTGITADDILKLKQSLPSTVVVADRQ